MSEQAPKALPLEAKAEKLYRLMALDPVRFFAASPNTGLEDIFSILSQMRTRAGLPEGNPGRFSMKRSETDADLAQFVVTPNSQQEYYVALFRIVRRLGFSTQDCITVLMKDIDLQQTTGDLTEWTALLNTAQILVDGDEKLPPVTRKIESAQKTKN